MNRRHFLKTAAGAAAAIGMRRQILAYTQTPAVVPLFGTSLRGIGTIGVAAADLGAAPVTGVTHYTINIDQYQDAGVCPSLGATTLRGYNPTRLLAGQNNRHLGGIIVGHKGQPIQLTFRNNLPAGPHILPNDLTIMGADLGANRAAVHFHGGLVPWISDGGPYAWWDPSGRAGQSFVGNSVLNPGAAANEAEYYYPLRQSARLGWYHDHAMGITRLNAYAGIASLLMIRDSFELGLVNLGLPNYLEVGGNEIPIVIQDKAFVGPNIFSADPTWTGPATPGSLWYPHVYERDRWKQSGSANKTPTPSCIPEFFGDTMLVNGTAFPKVTVEARRYRIRLLNACNARFLNLQLYVADGSPNGISLDAGGCPVNAPFIDGAQGAPEVLQLGTEGGFLSKPVLVATNEPFDDVAMTGSLVVAPAERPDLIVDFSRHAGQSIILYNDAPAPFPMGDTDYDYFPGLNTKEN
jgi:FtsP/CotA-like multicopper oxidase with cupredoxin domain